MSHDQTHYLDPETNQPVASPDFVGEKPLTISDVSDHPFLGEYIRVTGIEANAQTGRVGKVLAVRNVNNTLWGVVLEDGALKPMNVLVDRMVFHKD